MRRIVVFFLFMLMSSRFVAFSDSIDSLFHKIEKGGMISFKEANEFIWLLNEGGYADSLYRFTPSTEQKEMKLHIYSNAAYYYYTKSEFSESVRLVEKAIQIARQMNDTLAWSDNLAQLAIACQRQGNLETAIQTTLEGLRLDSAMQDTFRLSSTYNNLAGLYLTAQRPEEGKVYIDHAIELESSLANPEKLSIRYGIAAEIYVKLDLLPEALDFAMKAYELDLKSGNKLRVARRLSQMGDVYSAMRKIYEAERVYRESIDLLEQLGERTSLAICYKQLGSLYLLKDDSRRALHCLERSVDLAEQAGNKYLLRLAYEKLVELYGPDRPDLALKYMEKSVQLKDSLYTAETNRLLSDYQVRYETAKKEATIQQQESQLKEHRYMLFVAIYTIFVLFLVTLVVFFYFTKYRRLAYRERELNRQKEKLISILSHDIKNPLVTLLAAMRVFDKNVDAAQPALREQSRSMLTAMNRQLQLVENLLWWAKLQSGQWHCDRIRMDIRPIIDEVEKQLKLSFSEKGCVLVKELPMRAITMYADRQMVSIVLRNLLQNAIKYSYRDGQIYLSVQEEIASWRITVRDEGLGVAPAVRQQLQMQRAGITKKGTAGEEGTGIGLSICHELIQLCGGLFMLDQQPEKGGTSFSFTLQKEQNNG